MKDFALILTAIIFLSLPFYSIQPTNAQQTSDVDEYILVHEYSGGFKTYMYIGSFNASSGNYVGVDLSTSSTNSNYNEIEVQIVGATTGLAYDVRATRFAETFQLNNVDTYNITIIKRSPFYADLTVNGAITVYHRLVELRTNPPSLTPTLKPTFSPTVTPSPSPSPTPSTTQLPTINTGAEPPKTEPFPTVLIATVSVVTVALVELAGLLAYHKRKAKQFS